MLGYRLFLMGRDGHIARPVEFECENDEEAVRLAEDHASEFPMELWERARVVKKFPGQPAKAAGG